MGKKTSNYFQQSKRPLVSLVFILPLLILYEGGVLYYGPEALRNGVDVWLRQLLGLLGFGQYFLLPVLTVCILLAWHHTTGERWKFSGSVLVTMALECAVLGFVLVVIWQIQVSLLHSLGSGPGAAGGLTAAGGGLTAGGDESPGAFVKRVVGFCGAGLYEELLFRLMLLPGVAWLIKRLSASRLGGGEKKSIVGAVVLTSLAFSAAHYIGPLGDPFLIASFLFRFVAGGFFALLFVYRGFGIAAGTHAMYDIIVSWYDVMLS